MKNLEISPNFTIEDIHKIREYNEERRIALGDEAFWAEVHANSLHMQKRIKGMEEDRISEENINIIMAT
jgi:hypothetical protein